MTAKVVITGMGAITPFGDDITTQWEALRSGQSCFSPIHAFDASGLRAHIAGEIKHIDTTHYFPNEKWKKWDRTVVLSCIAIANALKDSDLPKPKQHECGLILGTGFGTITTKEQFYKETFKYNDPKTSLIILKGMDNAAASEAAIMFGLKGMNQTLFTACSSGLNAIGIAYRLIKDGYATGMIAGGVDAPITYEMVKAWTKLRIISRTTDYETASKPFSIDRDGFVISEGAGFLVLENEDQAKKRGANIYAEIKGFGSNCDAQHLAIPHLEQQQRAMIDAIKEANITPDDISYINAHGTATKQNDMIETKSVKAVFGKRAYELPISTLKSQLGHSIGACSAIETLFTVKMMQENIILPTLHYTPDPACDLDYVPNTPRRVSSMPYVIKNAFGFGGSNASLVLGQI